MSEREYRRGGGAVKTPGPHREAGVRGSWSRPSAALAGLAGAFISFGHVVTEPRRRRGGRPAVQRAYDVPVTDA